MTWHSVLSHKLMKSKKSWLQLISHANFELRGSYCIHLLDLLLTGLHMEELYNRRLHPSRCPLVQELSAQGCPRLWALSWQGAEQRPHGFTQAVNNHRSRLPSHCSFVMTSTPPSTTTTTSSILHHFPPSSTLSTAEGIPALSWPSSVQVSQIQPSCQLLIHVLCLRSFRLVNYTASEQLTRLEIKQARADGPVMCVGKTKLPPE